MSESSTSDSSSSSIDDYRNNEKKRPMPLEIALSDKDQNEIKYEDTAVDVHTQKSIHNEINYPKGRKLEKEETLKSENGHKNVDGLNKVHFQPSLEGNSSSPALELEPTCQYLPTSVEGSIDRAETPERPVDQTLEPQEQVHPKQEEQGPINHPIDQEHTPVRYTESWRQKAPKEGFLLLDPMSPFLQIWSIIMTVVWVYFVTITPIGTVFIFISWPNIIEFSIFFSFNIIFHTILFANIIIKFRTAEIEDGFVITNSKILASRYMKSYFIFDLLTSIPLDLILEFLILIQIVPLTTPVFIALAILRLPKFLFIVNILQMFSWLSLRLSIYMDPLIIRLAFLLFFVFGLVNFIACCYTFIGYLTGFGSTSYSPPENWSQISMFYSYILALRWSVAKIATAEQGTGIPALPVEILFDIAVMLSGLTIYALLIGSIGGMLVNWMNKHSSKFQALENVNTILRNHDVPGDLRKRVINYYNIKMAHGEDHTLGDILEEVPGFLRTEICMFLYRELLLNVPFFKNAEEALLHELVLELKPKVFAPNEYIFKFGDVGKEMYFINKGQVRVVSKNGTVVADLVEGNFFGEFAMLTNARRSASVITMTFCDFYILTKESFDKVCADFPEFSKKVADIAKKRIQETLGREGSRASGEKFVARLNRIASVGRISLEPRRQSLDYGFISGIPGGPRHHLFNVTKNATPIPFGTTATAVLYPFPPGSDHRKDVLQEDSQNQAGSRYSISNFSPQSMQQYLKRRRGTIA